METEAKTITCKLTTPELQKRKATVIAELKALVRSREELPNGFSFTFQATDENLDLLNVFIKTERMCCDFFTFQLTIGNDGIVRLDLTGPQGVKDFIREEIEL